MSGQTIKMSQHSETMQKLNSGALERARNQGEVLPKKDPKTQILRGRLNQKDIKVKGYFKSNWSSTDREKYDGYHLTIKTPIEGLFCVKCDAQHPAANCGNCDSPIAKVNSNGVCGNCSQVHQDSVWVCKDCGCKNTMNNSFRYSEEVSGPYPLLFGTMGCFVATVCYGDYNAPEVMVLRQYRDETLLQSFLGTLFVKSYYTVSPPLANLIAKSETAKKSIRKYFLQPIVNLLNRSKNEI